MYCEFCNGYNGEHASTCRNKYNAEKKEVYDECPCGIHRGDCYIHKRAKADPYEWGAYDANPLVIEVASPCVISGVFHHNYLVRFYRDKE